MGPPTMKRCTRVPATKIGRKTQIPPPPPRTPEEEADAIRELTRGVNEAMNEINNELAVTLSKAKQAQPPARTELTKPAQGLLEKARKPAEAGRPRLLAV